MSVNRNILQNSATPLAGDISPTEVNLVTTSGSRWVIIDFLNTVPTSSNGSCTAVNLEWSPDPSMVTNPYQPSSSYYAVTSSVFSCQSASLQPVTGSVSWLQYVDTYWRKSDEVFDPNLPSKYYFRAYQNRLTSPISIYSPALSVETNANVYCGNPQTGSERVPLPLAGASIFADMNAYQSSSAASYWYNDRAAAGPLVSASFGGEGTVTNVKAGGPNFDGLRIDGAGNVSWPQVIISSSNNVSCGVGIASGRVQWTVTSNGLDFLVDVNADAIATTSSITITKVSTGEVIGSINPFYEGINLQNRYVEFIFDSTDTTQPSAIKVDGDQIGNINFQNAGAAGTITLKNNFSITSAADQSILRCVTAQFSYKPDVFHCKYGPVGASSYTA
jgi:hypothetical protein